MKIWSSSLGIAVCAIGFSMCVSSCGTGSPTSPGSAGLDRQVAGATAARQNSDSGTSSANVASTPAETSQAGTSLPSAAGRPAKVPVCHFDDTAGRWIKLSVTEQAKAAHLKNHDDAAPSGTTPGGTVLDADCAAPCPCYTTDFVYGLFAPGEPTRDLSCTQGYAATWIQDMGAVQSPKYVVETWLNGPPDHFECYWYEVQGTQGPNITLSEAQHRGCMAVIEAAQVRLGCGQ